MRDGYDPNESQFRIGWLHDDGAPEIPPAVDCLGGIDEQRARWNSMSDYEKSRPFAYYLNPDYWTAPAKPVEAERSCTRCTGTGTLTDVHAYGPSSHFACFDCHGSGIAA